MSKAMLLVVALGVGQAGSEVYMAGINYKLPAVKISAEAIKATIESRQIEGYQDRPIRSVDAGGGEGGHQVAISIADRYKGFSDAGVVHDRVSEVYYILEGEGIAEVGGTLKDVRRRPASGGNGPGLSGSGIEGGQKMHLGKGDILIIPAGTPHRWDITQERTIYTITRVDPEKVAPLE